MEFDHMELFVPDPLKAASWYRDVLKFKILQEHYHWFEEGGPLMISNDGGRTMVALFQGAAQGDEVIRGFRRIAFRVPAPKFIDFLETSGRWRSKPFEAAEIQDHDKAISVYFADPYGNRLEVTSYEPDEIRTYLGGS